MQDFQVGSLLPAGAQPELSARSVVGEKKDVAFGNRATGQPGEMAHQPLGDALTAKRSSNRQVMQAVAVNGKIVQLRGFAKRQAARLRLFPVPTSSGAKFLTGRLKIVAGPVKFGLGVAKIVAMRVKFRVARASMRTERARRRSSDARLRAVALRLFAGEMSSPTGGGRRTVAMRLAGIVLPAPPADL